MKAATWYHASLKPMGRSSGRSAVACAAYRTGTSMIDERYDAVRDFSQKSDVVTHFTIAPEGAPAWATNAEQLWNAAESKESRCNSIVAREWEAALPYELDAGQREAIARNFSQWLVDEYGVAVTTGIHEGGTRGNGKNDHLHVMMTTRPLDENGWAKNKLRDFNTRPGQKNPEVDRVREQIADFINDALEDAGSDTRVDHRSFEARGITDIEPTKHLGPAGMARERAGLDGSDRADINREILSNREIMEERLRWQLEQEAPQITPQVAHELSQRWDDWQPLQRGVEARAGEEDPPPLERGTPPTTDEAHTGWRHFVDRVRSFTATFQTKASEFLHDETSGTPEARRGFVARIFDTGWKLWGGLEHDEVNELREGIEQKVELAADLAEKRAGGTFGDADATASDADRGQPKTFAERFRQGAAALLHNERGTVPDPGDDFDRMAAQWSASLPNDEGPPVPAAPEPPAPDRDGPDIE